MKTILKITKSSQSFREGLLIPTLYMMVCYKKNATSESGFISALLVFFLSINIDLFFSLFSLFFFSFSVCCSGRQTDELVFLLRFLFVFGKPAMSAISHHYTKRRRRRHRCNGVISYAVTQRTRTISCHTE